MLIEHLEDRKLFNAVVGTTPVTPVRPVTAPPTISSPLSAPPSGTPPTITMPLTVVRPVKVTLP